MFLVGYGLDSVIEIFGVSLEQRAATRLGAIKRRLALELMG
jgi:predicted transcriptional regulator